MGVVFAVLMILSIVVTGLGWLDRRTESPALATDGPSTQPSDHPAGDKISPETVAVIGAALALAQAAGGSAASPDPSESRAAAGWYSSGLTRQMETRTRQSIRRTR